MADRERFKSTHIVDDMGFPGGGVTHGSGFVISWDEASPYDLIHAALDRLRFYDSGRCLTKCPFPARAAMVETIRAEAESLEEADVERVARWLFSLEVSR